MYRSVLVNLTAMMAVASCLEWPAAVQAYNANRYGKQQLSQKQNRYGIPTWPSGVNRADGWTSSYGVGGGGMLRHHPVSAANRYREMAGGNRQILSDDYYDSDVVSPYERPRPYDRLDYAVVRYPSYGVGGGGGGYYPVSALAAYDDPTDDGDPTDDDDDDDDDDTFYENDGFGGAGRGPVSSPYYPTAVHRHAPPLSSSPSNRHDPARYPTDKIHKFRKVFMSNLVSPSNAFKSTKEQQLYDFWESLINGDLEHMGETDGAGRQQWADGQEEPSLESETGTSKLYQHLPLIFQQLQKQQKQKQHQQHRQPQQQQQLQQQQRQQQQHQQQLSVEERTPVQSPLSSLSSSSSSSSSSSPSSPLSSLSTMSHTVPHGNLYKQWANGSPLIKRSSDSDERVAPSLMTSTDNDEVRQLEKLKTGNPTANTTETGAVITDAAQASSTETGTAAVPMADGGQREYVLPRPAGEKSGFESLLEVIAEGGLHGNFDKNVAYSKLRQEAKVDKKRSYVSDETSLAAQLGALRKN